MSGDGKAGWCEHSKEGSTCLVCLHERIEAITKRAENAERRVENLKGAVGEIVLMSIVAVGPVAKFLVNRARLALEADAIIHGSHYVNLESPRDKKRRMPGNPKDSFWAQTPRSARKRKKGEISMSDEAWEKLDRLADGGYRSPVIEGLILAAPEPKTPKKKKGK